MKKFLLFLIFSFTVVGSAMFSYGVFSDGSLSLTPSSSDNAPKTPAVAKDEKLYGKQIINNETYYFDTDGEMQTGLQSFDDFYYYFNDEGIMLQDTDETISFEDVALPCHFNEEGKLGFVATMPEVVTYPGQVEAVMPAPESDSDFDIKAVQQGLEEIMSRYGGTTSVYFNDLTTDQKFCLNNKTMYPCCMIKTATLSTFMQQVENGEIDYNQYQQYIGPMIIDSDNTCYNRLMRGLGDGDGVLGATRLNEHAKSIGMNETAAHHGLMPGADYFTSGNISNVSCAQDIGTYFEKLYYGQLANPAHTKEMLDLYALCADYEGIVQGLPAGTVYAHKTGEAYACYHDGGIVYAEGRPYIVVAFTDGVVNNRAFLKEVSSYLYNYETSVK